MRESRAAYEREDTHTTVRASSWNRVQLDRSIWQEGRGSRSIGPSSWGKETERIDTTRMVLETGTLAVLVGITILVPISRWKWLLARDGVHVGLADQSGSTFIFAQGRCSFNRAW